MKTIDDEELKYAEGAEILVANALRFHGGHYSHQLVDDAIQLARRIGAKQTFLVHASHDMGLHEQVQKMLPQDVRMAYDNQIIQF